MLSLGHYKWYQNNLITQCDDKSLHNVGPNEDIMDLNKKNCDTLEIKVSPTLRNRGILEK